MTSRGWVFTLNNPEVEEWELLKNEKLKWTVWQLERGESGTLHWQGVLATTAPVRLPSLKEILPRAHWEKRRGSVKEAIEYCTKEASRVNGPFVIENGVMLVDDGLKNFLLKMTKVKINRSDELKIIKAKLDEGSTTVDQIAEDHFELWIRHFRAFEKYQLIKTKPRNHEVDVHVIQGPTGTGKSKWCMDNYPEAYWKQRSNWWDGYAGQEVVIIDEFYGWLPFDLVLRICDRYPLMVETKGGQVQFVAKTIIFTTNQIPSSWYKNCYFQSLARRVTKWHIMAVWEDHRIYDSWGEAIKEMTENVFVH